VKTLTPSQVCVCENTHSVCVCANAHSVCVCETHTWTLLSQDMFNTHCFSGTPGGRLHWAERWWAT
jgi:hypothetical protein